MRNTLLFDLAWRDLEKSGRCDARGSTQYRRLRELYEEPGFPKALLQDWICRDNHVLPLSPGKRPDVDLGFDACELMNVAELNGEVNSEWQHQYAIVSDLVIRCSACQGMRASLDVLKYPEADEDLAPRCSIPGVEDMRVKCENCGENGWVLTQRGKALVALMKELLPFALKEKEIPF